ncbi:MAG: HEAT repeat domain-containing protein [Planctomycetota bacterium]|jgi:HEAT repeat protein
MRRPLLLAILLSAAMSVPVFGHGGSYRGPNGGIPPGARPPSDPAPPPPPPSDPGDPDGPTSGRPPNGPVTPPDQGHDTPDAGPTPGPTPPTGPARGRTTTQKVTFDSWRFWWAYNNDDILSIKSHIFSKQFASGDFRYYATGQDKQNRVNARRPTQRAIEKDVIPALLRTLDHAKEHDDVTGGAVIALAKAGHAPFMANFDAILNDTYKTSSGRAGDFGPQTTESAALALGLLPGLDAGERDAVRRICLAAIANENLRRRDRAWAAISLGMQHDKQASKPLTELLKQRYADDNLPCAILAAIGMCGDLAVASELASGLVDGKLYGRDIKSNDRVRAFCGYALSKLGDGEAIPDLLKALKSRSVGSLTKRSSAIALGVLGAKASPDRQREIVRALITYLRTAKGDVAGMNFATIALSRIGTDKAMNKLLDLAENGRYSQRPFAALGLGTRVWYSDRAAEKRDGEPMDTDLRQKIVVKLSELSNKFKDVETRAAFMLARGLVQDKSAIEALVKTVSKRSAHTMLRGHGCVALGLIGDNSDDVKDALRLALQDRRDVNVRRNAATGLSLLRDATTVTLLLDELKKARSFAVQGQLITAIGTIGDYRAVTRLVELLDDKDQPTQTRAMAAVGLGMIADLQEVPKLARLSKDYNYRATVRDIDELLFIL